MYVIKDRRGMYVARSGYSYSYTKKLQHARVFVNQGDAVRNLCVENETIRAIRDEFGSIE